MSRAVMKALTAFASSNNQKTLFLPLEASSVIGAIGGIGEIAKEAFGKDKNKDSDNAASVPKTRASKS